MSSIPLDRVQLLKPHTSFLAKIGAPVGGILRRAKLPTLIHERPDAFVSTHLTAAFRIESARREGEDLGWLVGDQLWVSQAGSPTLLSAFGHALTLKHALESLFQKLHKEATHIKMWLIWQDDDAWLCWRQSLQTEIRGYHQSELFVASALIGLIQRWLGYQWYPTRMLASADAARVLARKEGLCETQFLLRRVTRAIHLPRSLLPLPPAPEFTRVSRTPSASASVTPSAGLVESLSRALQPYFREECPGIETAAAIAGCSVRTLQRRLEGCHLTYSDLIEQIRYQAATQALCGTDVKLLDLACELGYQNPSCFSRAFRRWAGVSPREYRRQRQGRL